MGACGVAHLGLVECRLDPVSRSAGAGEAALWRTSRKRLAAPVTCLCAATACGVRLAIIPFSIATRFMADLIRGSLVCHKGIPKNPNFVYPQIALILAQHGRWGLRYN